MDRNDISLYWKDLNERIVYKPKEIDFPTESIEIIKFIKASTIHTLLEDGFSIKNMEWNLRPISEKVIIIALESLSEQGYIIPKEDNEYIFTKRGFDLTNDIKYTIKE